MAFRGSVVRRDIGREQTTWIASINSTGLGEFLEREIAMRRVEELVESSMVLALHDCRRLSEIGQNAVNERWQRHHNGHAQNTLVRDTLDRRQSGDEGLAMAKSAKSTVRPFLVLIATAVLTWAAAMANSLRRVACACTRCNHFDYKRASSRKRPLHPLCGGFFPSA
jgi:hypothetical protein